MTTQFDRPKWMSEKDHFNSYTRIASKCEQEGLIQKAQNWRQFRWDKFPSGPKEHKA